MSALIGSIAESRFVAVDPGGDTDDFFDDLMILMETNIPDSYVASGGIQVLDQVLGNADAKFGTYSMDFVEETSARAVSFSDLTFPVLTTQDFCIECWVKADAEPGVSVIMSRNRGSIDSGQQFSIDYTPFGDHVGGLVETSSGTIVRGRYTLGTGSNLTIGEFFDGNWHHIAFVRNGAEIAFYVDGVKGNTTGSIGANATKDPTDWPTFIGAGSSANGDPTLGWPGLIDEVRFSVGVPRYTASFTPPTAAFPRDVGGDPDFATVKAIVSGNVENYFDIYGDAASISVITDTDDEAPHIDTNGRFAPHPSSGHYFAFLPDATAWNLGSGDFCIEVFDVPYPSNNSALVSLWDSADTKRGWSVTRISTSGLSLRYSTDATNALSISENIDRTGDTDRHDFCIERSGSILRFYVDGSMTRKVTGFTPVIANPSGQYLGIGENNRAGTLATEFSNVSMGPVRVTKAARYDSDGGYTVPTTPLPKVAT